LRLFFSWLDFQKDMSEKFTRTPSAARLVKGTLAPHWQRYVLMAFGLMIGICIGFTFEKGKIFLPAVIKSQMVLKDFSMMKMFLAGTAAGMFAVALLLQVRLQNRVPVKLALGFQVMRGYGANVVGGLIMGLGINISGACPGTMLAQIGSGVPYAGFTVAGALCGAIAFTTLHSLLRGTRFHFKEEAVLVDEYFGIHIVKLSVLFSLLVVTIVAALEHFSPWSSTIAAHVVCSKGSSSSRILDIFACSWSPIKAGVIMGLLQIPTFFFLDQNIAVSSSFVSVIGAPLHFLFPSKWIEKNVPYLSNFYGINDFGQLGSSVGIVLGSFLSAHLSGVHIIHDTDASATASFFGGFLVLLGARLAGGCASGHGLSGIARLSSASLVTSACMFVGAIGSGMLLRGGLF
jgi:uncharacterized membrane protein YedE/YeeE